MDAQLSASNPRFGAIHGRFQPFHRGHLEYALAASRLCHHLYIGITNYDLSAVDTASPQHRFDLTDNPFSYWERAAIVSVAVEAEGLSHEKYTIVPFPIENPNLIKNFVPSSTVMFTTIYEKWNIEKIKRLRSEGFDVCVLWRRRIKKFEGKMVRAILRDDPSKLTTVVQSNSSDLIQRLWSLKTKADAKPEM